MICYRSQVGINLYGSYRENIQYNQTRAGKKSALDIFREKN